MCSELNKPRHDNSHTATCNAPQLTKDVCQKHYLFSFEDHKYRGINIAEMHYGLLEYLLEYNFVKEIQKITVHDQ